MLAIMEYERRCFEKWRLKLGPHHLIQTLSSFISTERQKKIDIVLSQRLSGIDLAIESPYDIHNVFAAIRSSEALGVSKTHLINFDGKHKSGKNATTSGTHRWIHMHKHEKTQDFLRYAKNHNYLVAGASLDASITVTELPVDKNIIIVFGNEQLGLSEEAKNGADILFYLPMFGMAQSYNLSVSCALALNELTLKKRQYLKRLGNLSEQDKLLEKAWFYFKTLGITHSNAILIKENPLLSST